MPTAGGVPIPRQVHGRTQGAEADSTVAIAVPTEVDAPHAAHGVTTNVVAPDIGYVDWEDGDHSIAGLEGRAHIVNVDLIESKVGRAAIGGG